MIFKIFLTTFLLVNSFFCYSQQEKFNSKLTPYKIGIFYGVGNEKNFAFDNHDYFYKTQILKVNVHYAIRNGFFQLELNLQPQLHFIKHQLLNKYFVLPTDENYEENRLAFTKLKSIRLYALQFELLAKRKISKRLEAIAFFAIGPAIIDTETERLSRGFTFIENIGLGLSFELREKLFLDIKPSFNHISNGEFQLSNSGYNTINFEIGFSIIL